MLNVKAILDKYFRGEVLAMVVTHGSMVAGLSVSIGRSLGLSDGDLQFLEQAAMLHDIGICQVRAPEIGLHGDNPYIMHGILGRAILEEERLPRHALICERHIGVGLTEADIARQGLPLPIRDMTPQGVVEEIVCFADLFFSKKPGSLEQMKTRENVRQKLAKFGEEKLQIFDSWLLRFGAVFKDDCT